MSWHKIELDLGDLGGQSRLKGPCPNSSTQLEDIPRRR